MKISALKILLAISLISILNLDLFIVKAEEERVWECFPNSCNVPNQYKIHSKNHVVEEGRKFQFKIEKTLANETKKFPQYGRQNKNILELDKRRQGNFSAYSVINSGN